MKIKIDQLIILGVAVFLVWAFHPSVFSETVPTADQTTAYIPTKPVPDSTQPAQTPEDTEAVEAFVNATEEPGEKAEAERPERTARELGTQTQPDGTRVKKIEILQDGRRVGIVYNYYPPNSREPNLVEVFSANQERLSQEITLRDRTRIFIPWRNGLPVPGETRINSPDPPDL